MKTFVVNALFGLLGLTCVASSLQAQATFAAERRSDLEVGAGVQALNPDYTDTRVYGLRFWGTFNFTRRFGLDAEYNMGSIITPQDISETSFMVGPRVTIRRRRAAVYGKLLAGVASISNHPTDQPGLAFDISQNPYSVYAFGGGFEYRMTRKIRLRPIDVEVQKWGNFEPHTLTPILITVGATYVIR